MAKRNKPATATYDAKSDQYVVTDNETGQVIHRAFNKQYAKQFLPYPYKIVSWK